jgi:GNAT superfamily N-acetyltransferase
LMRADYVVTSDLDELRAAIGDHPYLRSSAGLAGFTAYLGPTATIWHSTERPMIGAMGDPQAALEIVVGLVADGVEAPRVSLPRIDHAAILEAFPGVELSDWELRWSESSPPVMAGESRVVTLAEDASDQINAVLDAALPEAHTRPGDDRVRQWFGIHTDEDGDVLAVAADCTSSGVGRINSIAVRPDRHGQGLGGALTAAVVRRLRTESEFVQLGVMDSNVGAQRLYARLGFTRVHKMTSFRLT